MPKIGFVGLGVMGGQMADHIYLAGFELMVFNRSLEKAERFRENGVPVADSLEMMAEVCDQVFLCVRATEDVEQCLGELSRAAKPGTLIVDHSTILPSAAERFHGELGSKGLRFVDAPITGGSMGAAKGTLTIFCGGDPKDIYAATPVMNCYSKRSECVGGPGAGQKMKMANQIAVAGSLLGLCESLAFAEKAGLSLSQAWEMLSTGAAGSWAFENYGPKILSSDWSPGFTIENQLKDLDYCEKAAKEYGASVPGSKLVNKLLSEMQDAGKGGLTTAALYEKLLES